MFLIPYRDDNTARSFPFLTVALIAANCWLFFRNHTPEAIALVANRYGFTTQLLFQHPEVMLSSLFLHGSILHLIGNMWFLWLFGDNIEDRFGRLPFLTLYLFSGIAGNLLQAVFSMFSAQTPVIGASGAVAGVMGSYLLKFPGSRVRTIFLLVFYPIFFRIRAFWFIGVWMIGEFVAAYFGPTDYVAHWAHIGGFIFGFIWAYGRRERYYHARSA